MPVNYMGLDLYVVGRIDFFVKTLGDLADLRLPYSSLARQIEGDSSDLVNICDSMGLKPVSYVERYLESAAGLLLDKQVEIV